MRQILARACIVSAPKLVARRLLDRASEADAALGAQLQAMARLRYRAYVVTNVLLSKPVRSPSAELMVLRGRAPRAGERRPFTDLIFAAWAGGDRAERSALTFYRCMPYAEARRELLGEGAHARIHSEFENALPPILQALGIPRAEVAAIRHARWGHAIPLGEPGLIASGTLERAARPIGGRIFFAEQDNWANPCFESAAGAAFRAADAVRGALA